MGLLGPTRTGPRSLVGLTQPGATCHLAPTIQQPMASPSLQVSLHCQVLEDIKHKTTLAGAAEDASFIYLGESDFSNRVRLSFSFSEEGEAKVTESWLSTTIKRHGTRARVDGAYATASSETSSTRTPTRTTILCAASGSSIPSTLPETLKPPPHDHKPHSKHLTEYFAFLYEFAKMGEEESQFLLSLQAISIMVHFYMGTKGPENPQVEVLSEEEGEEETQEEDIRLWRRRNIALPEKMIKAIASVGGQSRSGKRSAQTDAMMDREMAALDRRKGFLPLHIRDAASTSDRPKPHLQPLCRHNNRLAEHDVICSNIVSCRFELPDIESDFEYNPPQCLDWLAADPSGTNYPQLGPAEHGELGGTVSSRH
ncbi:ubiquitin carboxyl-terminal hydrolase 34 [Lates japonicus]|uniref:Ubiquitin carboxyl-terminal hydrolase 34 n=1 Tax=Lates japonicus TaxID=270547 RepID=A0AAD3NA80_LATJO|nr:ubiquitin carboxyl-terminal hydrolase 34 [Lates japonicus]